MWVVPFVAQLAGVLEDLQTGIPIVCHSRWRLYEAVVWDRLLVFLSVDPVSCGRLLIRLLVLGSIQLTQAAAKVDRRRCTTPHYVQRTMSG